MMLKRNMLVWWEPLSCYSTEYMVCRYPPTSGILTECTGNSPREDIEKNRPTIQGLLSSKSLWAYCCHDDAFVRRSMYILLRSAVSQEPEDLDWKIISAALVGKSLSISQVGSASELSETILQVTGSRPQLWTEDYSGKSSSSKRLHQYIQKGSQGGSASFWPNLSQLLRLIPLQTLSRLDPQASAADHIGLSSATALAGAFQGGLNSRDESRQNQVSGWKSYIETGMWLMTLLSDDDRGTFVQGRLCPLLAQHVNADPTQSQWSLPDQSAQAICAECLVTLVTNGREKDMRALWVELSDKLLESVRLSSPEQSKEFTASQDIICAQAKRLLSLEAAALGRLPDTESETRALNLFEEKGLPLLESCLEVLRSRNGKPYGAAAVVEETIHNVPQIAQRSRELLKFVQDDAPELLFSPSADRLVAIILSCRAWKGFALSFERIVERVIQLGPEGSNAHVLQRLLSTLDFKEVDDKTGLRTLIMQSLNRACQGSSSHWPIVIAVLQNQTSHGELTDLIFQAIMDSLVVEDTALDVLRGLSRIASSVPSVVRDFQSGPNGSKLAGKLLFLTESPEDDVAMLAESLLKTLKATVVGETSTKSGVEILRYNFDHVGEESLS